jgi:hypothetical protein
VDRRYQTHERGFFEDAEVDNRPKKERAALWVRHNAALSFFGNGKDRLRNLELPKGAIVELSKRL